MDARFRQRDGRLIQHHPRTGGGLRVIACANAGGSTASDSPTSGRDDDRPRVCNAVDLASLARRVVKARARNRRGDASPFHNPRAWRRGRQRPFRPAQIAPHDAPPGPPTARNGRPGHIGAQRPAQAGESAKHPRQPVTYGGSRVSSPPETRDGRGHLFSSRCDTTAAAAFADRLTPVGAFSSAHQSDVPAAHQPEMTP